MNFWGVDLGGTKIECAVVDSGKALIRRRIATEADRGYEHKPILGDSAGVFGAALLQ